MKMYIDIYAPITRRDSFGFSFLAVFIFLSLCFVVMSFGHLHEDAYILYIYSENLSQTGVISYFSGGEPTEGATDFLWMVMIAALHSISVPSGVASALLNAIGLFGIIIIISKCISKYGGNRILLMLISLFLPFSNICQAAVFGFSTAFYSSIIAALIYLVMFSKDREVLLIPILGLILALVRPDGAIIGILTTLMYASITEKSIRVHYLILTLICAIIGFLYFVWRWNYFGELLPLPLVVKSSSDALLPGLGTNLNWLLALTPLLSLALASLFFMKGKYKRALVASLPILIYFASLSFAVQSQNIGYRFQAPVFILLLIFASMAFAKIWISENKPGNILVLKMASIFAISFPLLVVGLQDARTTAQMVRGSLKGEYIDVFPFLLGKHLDESSTVVLTEAGRLAYWMPGKKFDLVGLNTAETAIQGATIEYIRGSDPDLIMVHHSGTIPSIKCEAALDFCRVSEEDFIEAFDAGSASRAISSDNRVRRAAAVTAQFLIEDFGLFAVYAVNYGGQYYHIYAVRLGGHLDVRDFEQALSQSFNSESRMSYLQMVNR